MTKPEIVCICGSTRFKDEWAYWRQQFTCDGKIVLAIEIVTSKDMVTTDPELKSRLDELHKRKIDLADRVFILNVEGYIGDSTRSEIEYAERFGKPVEYLEPQSILGGDSLHHQEAGDGGCRDRHVDDGRPMERLRLNVVLSEKAQL